MKHLCICALAATLGMVMLTAPIAGEEGGVKLTPSGYGSYEVGQILEANPNTISGLGYQTNNLLFQKSFIGLNLKATYNPLPIETNIGVELKSFTETPRKKIVSEDGGTAVRFYYFFYLTRLDFIYSFGKAFNVDIGYFPVKYNENSRNLGEYLFRSGTYPQYLTTNFDFAAARVTGINTYGTLIDNFTYQTLLTLNTEGATMGDLNFTGIAFCSLLNKFLDIGAGFSLCSFFSANSNHTHPPKEEMSNPAGRYIDENGDTATYTFAGTKLMGRLSIDPKALFSNSLFGEQDLKLYTEAAVLGITDYPVSVGDGIAQDTSSLATRYDDITKRIPIMFGFNFPAFNILDVLSIELQWFGSNYPNDLTNYVLWGNPVAISRKWDGGGYSTYTDTTRDNWKWSVYAKKTLAGHFHIIGQIASDHLRWDKFDYKAQADMLSDALTQTRHKYYVIKLGYGF